LEPVSSGTECTLESAVGVRFLRRAKRLRWFLAQGDRPEAAGPPSSLAAEDEHSGFSIDASERISLSGPKVRAYGKPLEHLVRYCARPAFDLERLTVIGGGDIRLIVFVTEPAGAGFLRTGGSQAGEGHGGLRTREDRFGRSSRTSASARGLFTSSLSSALGGVIPGIRPVTRYGDESKERVLGSGPESPFWGGAIGS